MTDWKSFQNLPPLKHYTEDKMTLFYLEHEFLYSLNPKYSLSLSENCKKIKANKEAFYSRRLNKDWYRVYYEFNSTIEDFSVLTHEYIHHLSAQFPKIKTDTSAYSVYTECLSLLGELKCLDFLKSISSSQDEINKCIKIIRNRYQQNINHFLTIEPLLDIYLSKEKFSADKIEELLDHNPFYKAIGENLVFQNISLLAKEPQIEICLDYQHPLGMIKAASLHQDQISNDYFSYLIDIINTVEVDEFEKILPQKTIPELVTDAANEFNFQLIKK